MQLIIYCALAAIVFPLSLLPMPVLYLISNILYVFLYRIIGFRRKIVFSNLKNAFPEKSDAEIKRIASKFYRNLCDLIVENLKMISISKKEVLKRCKMTNLQLLENCYNQGKSVIITIGHCGNWELTGLAASLRMKHHSIVFYRKFKNPYFDAFIRKKRAQFGMDLLPHTSVRHMLSQEGKQPNQYIFITDQTPSNAATAHWTTFLNQDTAVYKGTEKTARLTGHPVIFGNIIKEKRGYYSVDFRLLTDDPRQLREGEITELHTRALEESIIKSPDNWLWTHRRWKKKRPVTSDGK